MSPPIVYLSNHCKDFSAVLARNLPNNFGTIFIFFIPKKKVIVFREIFYPGIWRRVVSWKFKQSCVSCLLLVDYLLGLIFSPEDGVSKFLRNVCEIRSACCLLFVGYLLGFRQVPNILSDCTAPPFTRHIIRRYKLLVPTVSWNSPQQKITGAFQLSFFLWRYSPHLGLGLPPWNFPLSTLSFLQKIGLNCTLFRMVWLAYWLATNPTLEWVQMFLNSQNAKR
jgi:hypothetical protein